MSAAEQVMWQLERLLIPILLSLGDLAVYALVGAVAVAPYHVLAAGAGATLIPRLQAAPSRQERMKLISHETLIMLALSALGGLLILLLMPPLVEWYLGSKIVVTRTLLLAAVAGGVARITGRRRTHAGDRFLQQRRIASHQPRILAGRRAGHSRGLGLGGFRPGRA